MFRMTRSAALGVVLSTAFAVASVAIADIKGPQEHKGVSVSNRAALELGPQIPAMEGYQVRIRKVVVEPGGVVKQHEHSTRPGTYFVIRGDGVAEYRGGKKNIVPAGTAVLESQDVDHWIINEGNEAEFFVFDIVPVDN